MPPKEPKGGGDAAGIEETLLRLQRGGDHTLDLAWPGRGPMVRLRILTRSERQLRFADTWNRFKALGIEQVTLESREEFYTEQITQILAVSIMDPTRPIAGTRALCEPYFADADECRDHLTDDETAAFWDAYVALEREANPLGKVPPEVIDTLREAQKKRAPDLLKGIAPSLLRSWLASMDDPPSISPSGRSGSGESPATHAPLS